MALHNLGYARFLRGDLVSALEPDGRRAHLLAPRQPGQRAAVRPGPRRGADGRRAAGAGPHALLRRPATTGRAGCGRRQGEAELALARSLLRARPGRPPNGPRGRPDGASSAWRPRPGGPGRGSRARGRGRAGRTLAGPGGARGPGGHRAGGAGTRPGTAMSLRLQVARILVRRGARRGGRAAAGRAAGRSECPADGAAAVPRRPGGSWPARGRRAEALEHLRAGLDDLQGWLSSFGNLDLQTMVAGHGTRLGVRGLALAVESRSPACCFEWSERARMLASRVQPVRAPRRGHRRRPGRAAGDAAAAEPAARRHRPPRPSSARGSGSGPGSTAAPARSPTRARSTSCGAGWTRTRRWWRTS